MTAAAFFPDCVRVADVCVWVWVCGGAAQEKGEGVEGWGVSRVFRVGRCHGTHALWSLSGF